jgi:hypothetical protein
VIAGEDFPHFFRGELVLLDMKVLSSSHSKPEMSTDLS